MKLTASQIRQVESDQSAHGTRVALGNFLWQLGADMMKAAGVRKITTQYARPVAKAKAERRAAH